MVGTTRQKEKADPVSRDNLGLGPSENHPQFSEEDDDDQEEGEYTDSTLEFRAAALVQDKVHDLHWKPGTFPVGSGSTTDTRNKDFLASDPPPHPRGGGRGQGYREGRFGAICEHCKAFGHEETKCKFTQQEEDQQAWTTVKKGKGIQATKRIDHVFDIPSSSTGPLGVPPKASPPADPVNRRRSSSPTNPALRKEHAATASPHPRNKFSLLSEASGLPEIDAAERSNIMLDGTNSPRTVPDSNQAQVSCPQHSPQSQGKQANKKAGSKGKNKRKFFT
ncbi:hypothetical protein U1Q18_016919 [Sarracenia purpurea var. burkii]